MMESDKHLIHDPREYGGICFPQDDVKVLTDSSMITRDHQLLHLVVAHHMSHNCVEICSVNVRMNIEAPRIYVNYAKLKNIINPNAYNERIAALKVEILLQRREFIMSRAAKHVSDELIVEFLMRRLHRSEHSSDEQGIFVMNLGVESGDASKEVPHPDDVNAKVQVLDMICRKPWALHPVTLNRTILEKHIDALSAARSLPVLRATIRAAQDQIKEQEKLHRQLTQFTSLRDLPLDDLRDFLEAQYQYLHTDAWMRWKLAMSKVMVRMVLVPRMKRRVACSCVSEWYREALHVRAENAEEAQRRRQQDERISEIAAAELPKKMTRVRPCYSSQALELEKQKRETVEQLNKMFHSAHHPTPHTSLSRMSTSSKLNTPKKGKSVRMRRHSIDAHPQQSAANSKATKLRDVHTPKRLQRLKTEKLPRISDEQAEKKTTKPDLPYSLRRRHTYDNHVESQLQGFREHHKQVEERHDSRPSLLAHISSVEDRCTGNSPPPSVLQAYVKNESDSSAALLTELGSSSWQHVDSVDHQEDASDDFQRSYDRDSDEIRPRSGKIQSTASRSEFPDHHSLQKLGLGPSSVQRDALFHPRAMRRSRSNSFASHSFAKRDDSAKLLPQII